MHKGTPPRDAAGNPISYVVEGCAEENRGKWFAYRSTGNGWQYGGLHGSGAAARAAVGMEAR